MAGESLTVIDGWTVSCRDGGRFWTAVRRKGLSDAQLEYGCRLIVGASSLGELRVQCTAEGVKAGIVEAAERMVERMAEPDRSWRGGAR